MSRRQVWALCAAAVLLAVLLVALPLVAGFEGRMDVVEANRAACERSKLDRIDDAAGWTAHRDYIQNLTQAASIKEDIKREARVVIKVYERISVDLTKRSLVDCERENPPASVVP